MPVKNVWRRFVFQDELATQLQTASDGYYANLNSGLADKAPKLFGLGSIITTNRTLVPADVDYNSLIRIGSASNLTCTIPTNATAAIPVGSTIPIARWGTGTVTLVTTGLTIRCARAAPYTIAAQYGEPVLATKVGTDEWWLTGGLT